MAFRDLKMKVPVVVRLRGTNEELGQKMVRILLIFPPVFEHDLVDYVHRLSVRGMTVRYFRLRKADSHCMHLTCSRRQPKKSFTCHEHNDFLILRFIFNITAACMSFLGGG